MIINESKEMDYLEKKKSKYENVDKRLYQKFNTLIHILQLKILNRNSAELLQSIDNRKL